MSSPPGRRDEPREGGRGAPMPRTEGLRLVGPPTSARGPVRIGAPLAVTFRDDAVDVAIALGPTEAEDATTIARALPEPGDLAAGALVVVLPDVAEAPSLTRRVLSVLGRTRAVPRVLRCTALVARGFVEVGGGIDPTSGADLAWGRAPS